MEESGSNDLLSQHRRLKSSSQTSLNIQNLSTAGAAHSRFPFHYFSPESAFSGGAGAGKRSGIPPIPPSPSSRSPSPAGGGDNPFHSRSLSQPTFFSLDSLPFDLSNDVETVPDAKNFQISSSQGLTIPRTPGGVCRGSGDLLPPRKGHRRSQSGDFNFAVHHQPALSPATERAWAVKQEAVSVGDGGGGRKQELNSGDDLISEYMNLDNLDGLNSSGTDEKNEDLDSSRLSGSKMNESSENEAESSVNESVGDEKKDAGNKRAALDDLMPVNSQHFRSLSMDSMMGKLHFGDESPKFLPSPDNQAGQVMRSGLMDGPMTNSLGLEMGTSEFSSVELNKIMANEKLAEMALSDPKRVKRILANRQSAARSKERKMRYISELEHKVQTLQTEATTLSAQLTLLQRDSAGLSNQNSELKFCLQAMEQQAKIREALNEALSAEVHRLKLATGELNDAQLSKSINQQMQINSQAFHLQQLQLQQQYSGQTPPHQFQSPQQPPQQQKDASPRLEQTK